MPFKTDPSIPSQAPPSFGEYRTTFLSEGGQVVAHLFDAGGALVAHVDFRPGWDGSTVTDPYVGLLKGYARETGYGDKVRLVFADRHAA